jgi:hypothetical protein
MSQSNPFDDLAKVFGAMDAIASRNSKHKDLSDRLQYAQQLNEWAAKLLDLGPKGFGGPEKWMAARDHWLENFRRFR